MTEYNSETDIIKVTAADVIEPDNSKPQSLAPAPARSQRVPLIPFPYNGSTRRLPLNTREGAMAWQAGYGRKGFKDLGLTSEIIAILDAELNSGGPASASMAPNRQREKGGYGSGSRSSTGRKNIAPEN